MYGIREVLLTQVRGDYSEHLSAGDFKLDCSMGSNPYGTPPISIPEITLRDLAEYPETDAALVSALRERFAPILDITPDMLVFSCGSIASCMELTRMCMVPGKAIVCMAPTFTAVTDDMATYEPAFKRVYLRPEDNYAFDAQALIDAIEENPGAYVYVDNPNNPTGQVFPLEDVRRVAQAARDAGSFITMDEAYGDYMPDDQSALNLVSEFDNLAVVRTFSKGWGLAGVRLGYTVAQPQVAAALHKVNVPYSKNSIAHELACQAIASGWALRTRERVLRDKPRVLAALAACKNLHVAHSSNGVCISMVYVDDGQIDLEQVFAQAGVRVVTCAGYDGLGKNAVRLNLHENVDALVELIGQVDELAGRAIASGGSSK